MTVSAAKPEGGRMPRRVLAVNRFYRPDNSATSQMLGDLAERLASDGWSVSVLASRNSYEGRSRHVRNQSVNGVDVKRIWTSNFGRQNLLGRSFDYLSFYISATFSLIASVKRDDILIVKTDPPLISIIGLLIARTKGARLVNWCQDLFPETAAVLGVKWLNGPAGASLRWARNISLRNAAMNVVLHEKMSEFLRLQGVESKKIAIVENWPDKDIHPIAKPDNGLRKSWGFGDEIIIGYSGNLGRAHMPEKISQLVLGCSKIQNLRWLFIGGGAGLDRLRALLPPQAPVSFQPYQPLKMLSESLSVADIHLVSLDPGCEGLIVPSKFYGILAVNRAVLFLGAPDGAIARDVQQLGVGEVLDSDEPETWPAIVSDLVCRLRSQGCAPATSNGLELSERQLAKWCGVLQSI